jgi:hypothetical protein
MSPFRKPDSRLPPLLRKTGAVMVHVERRQPRMGGAGSTGFDSSLPGRQAARV